MSQNWSAAVVALPSCAPSTDHIRAQSSDSKAILRDVQAGQQIFINGNRITPEHRGSLKSDTGELTESQF